MGTDLWSVFNQARERKRQGSDAEAFQRYLQTLASQQAQAQALWSTPQMGPLNMGGPQQQAPGQSPVMSLSGGVEDPRMPQYSSQQWRGMGQQVALQQMQNQVPLNQLDQARTGLLRAQTQTALAGPRAPIAATPWYMDTRNPAYNTPEAQQERAKMARPGTEAPWFANPDDPNFDTNTAKALREREITKGPSRSEVQGKKALEIEKKIQAGTATEQERSLYDRLVAPSAQSITVQQRVPKQWYDDLEKNITALDNIKRLRIHMKPGGGGANTVGVRDQIVTWVQTKLGKLPEDKSVYTSDKAKMYSLIKATSEESRMSDQDLKWLAKILPQEWQSDAAFRAVLDSLGETAQAQYNRKYEVLKDPQMGAVVSPSYDVYYTGGVVQQGRQANPPMSVAPQSSSGASFRDPATGKTWVDLSPDDAAEAKKRGWEAVK